MAIREGLLVLLSQGPRHGYQLKLDFEAATGEAWTLNVGQVYSTLQRLERDGLVEADSQDDDGRIAYRLTAAGLQEATDWVAQPIPREIANRDELSMKVLLVLAAGAGDPGRIIDRQRESTMVDLQDYTQLRADTPDDQVAFHLQLDRLALQAEAELRWLDRVERRLARGTPGADTTDGVADRRPDDAHDDLAPTTQEADA